MAAQLRREPSEFWRRARRDDRRGRQPVPPPLPLGALVRVPDRGDVFFRYQAGPQGAPTVLLLHGWMASADLNWLGTFPALAGRYHVVAMDHRGHGRGIRTREPFSSRTAPTTRPGCCVSWACATRSWAATRWEARSGCS
jgi:pimeloyl-ACP methyl ester carboxylesterase